MKPVEPDGRALSGLVELLKGSARPPNRAELERGLHALRARLASERSRRRRGPRAALLLAAVLGAVVSIAGIFVVFREPAVVPGRAVALSRIEGGRLLDGGYLAQTGRAGVGIYFDEGSQFMLDPGARGRLRQVSAEGARLSLDHGSATLRITENPSHRWSVESGPFVVTVKGTDFSVSWDPASERFEVRLRRGRVEVEGPVVGEGLALRPGQRLIVNLPKAETVITEEQVGPGATASAVALPAPAPTPPVAAAPSNQAVSPAQAASAAKSSAGTSSAGTERRWREALANGQWDRILTQADRDGVDATLRSASSDDLFALADAARYRRRMDLARATLLAQRNRFPTSARSLDALFLLGRVEEARSGRAQAIAWYDEYLLHAPAGTYAAEALGRKLVLTKELAGPAGARPIAEEYLRRFPEGSYAGTARALRALPGTDR